MDFIAWLNGIGGILLALGAFFSGVAALLPQIAAPLPRRQGKGRSGMTAKKARRFTGLLGIALLLASGATLVARAISEPAKPLNVVLTTAAWDALNSAAYDKAATFADSCIAEFRGAADEDQAQLEKAKAPLPTKGKATEAQKKEIHAQGLLNDVGTCYFIKGKAYEALGLASDARKAYIEAKRLTYARCWDPKGWFWSPSDGASGRISEIDAKDIPAK